MEQSSGEPDVLRQLAEAAGISRQWRDHKGEMRSVDPDVLRTLLDALELPSGSDQQCRESLKQIQVQEQAEVPTMITGRCGERLCLPAALAQIARPEQRLPVRDEDGCSVDIAVEEQGGQLCLAAFSQPGYYTLTAGDREMSLAIAPHACLQPQELTGKARSFGLAAQIYSLRRPGDGGIGDFTGLGHLAAQCADRGADALAISPVHALFSADLNRYSPYAPSSRLFLNVWYADPAAALGAEAVSRVVDELGLEAQMAQLEQDTLIDWPAASRAKLAVMRGIWSQLADELLAGEGSAGREFHAFCQGGETALEQHAIFETLHAERFGKDWQQWHWRTWPEELQSPQSDAVKRFASEHAREVKFHCFLQWLAAKGLADADSAARRAGMGIGLIADLAIGTDSGGSHSWSRQHDMLNRLSVGAPPDLINHQGQNWGLTTFSPRALQAQGYQPFIEMLRASLRYAGGLRIDHVLGLRRLWLIPEGATATQGAYLSFPQRDLLNLIALESWRHRSVIVGEDLGTVPEGFREQISDVGLLGMQVLWFEQEHGLYVEPSRWHTSAMATTTTHDLPTVAGWWRGRDIHWNVKLNRLAEGSSPDKEYQQRAGERQTLWAAFEYAGVGGGGCPPASDPEHAVDAAIRFVSKTPSPLAIVPVEDVLGVDEQPNLPGTVDEHPNWRRRLPVTTEGIFRHDPARQRLAALAARTGDD